MAAGLLLSFGGCGENPTGSWQSRQSEVPQLGIEEVRACTDELLKEMLAQKGITDYEIENASLGFITDDPVIYIVGYCYHYSGGTQTYGYKLHRNGQEFSVIEEGTEVGEFMAGISE